MRTVRTHLRHPAEWSEAERADVAEVHMRTERDDVGISYAVCVALRSLAASAFEDGEDRIVLWVKRVDFGTTDATCAGGAAFVHAAKEQERIVGEVTAAVWGGR